MSEPTVGLPPPERPAGPMPPPERPAGPLRRPPLRRSRTDRKLVGVCGGLGRYTDIDPLVFRVTIAVLALFGGAGVLIYGIAWLLVPDEGESESEGERLLRGRADRSAIAAIVAILVGLGVFGGFIGNGLNTAALVLLCIVAVGLVVAVREGGPRSEWLTSWTPTTPDPPQDSPPDPARSSQPETSSAPAGPQAAAVGSPPPYQPYTRTAAPAYPPPPPPPPPPYQPIYVPPAPPKPRRRSALGGLVLSAAVIVAGVISSLALWANGEVDLQVVMASVLLVLGTGLVVGAWVGRARGLIVLGAIVTFLLVTTASWSLPMSGGVGGRTWRPVNLQQLDRQSPYRLAAGEAELDLRKVDFSPTSETTVEASVGFGQLTVLVPPEVNLEGSVEVGAGDVLLPGDDESIDGLDVDTNIDVPGTTTATVVLELAVGAGQVKVLR